MDVDSVIYSGQSLSLGLYYIGFVHELVHFLFHLVLGL